MRTLKSRNLGARLLTKVNLQFYMYGDGWACTAGMRRFTVIAALIALAARDAGATQKQTIPAIRWAENATNCTFRDGDDGRTYYGLSSGDFEITLAVDRQELEKIPH